MAEGLRQAVVNDESEYEGNVVQCWGSITAQELVHRFWITVMRGGYAGHGETYSQPDDLLWWAKGGELHGESYERIGFLLEILKEDVSNGLTPFGLTGHPFPWTRVSGAADGDVRYVYFGEHQPVIWSSGFPQEDGDYDIDIIDTWNMTVTPLRSRIPSAMARWCGAARRTRRLAWNCPASPIWQCACGRAAKSRTDRENGHGFC